MFDYKVSVITAIYNVAPFLRETIDSVIAQDIGFGNIQLILVNDGSTDNSGAICDEYAQRYPNNIVVIHKENGGVSSARNEGLQYVKGEYINFLDGDDKLATNAVSAVCAFFDANKDKTDVVSIPIHFFDQMDGEHILNYKFHNGSRIIDLDVEYDNPQLSISSSFVKSEVMLQHKFDTRLAYAEDAQVLIRILLNKCTLGVVSNTKYLYRRRSTGEGSALQTATHRADRYIPYIQHFQNETIHYCIWKLSSVPYFVQYTLMYDLQWRITQEDIPEGVLSKQQKSRYYTLIGKVMKHIDDKIIMEQKNLSDEEKFWALSVKNGKFPAPRHRDSDVVFSFHGTQLYKASQFPFYLEFISFTDTEAIIEGSVISFAYNWDVFEAVCSVNGTSFPVPFHSCSTYSLYMGTEHQREYLFKARLPLDTQSPNQISFALNINGTIVPISQLLRKKFFPLTDVIQTAYARRGNWIVQNADRGLCITHAEQANLKLLEKNFCKDLNVLNLKRRAKALFIRKLTQFISKHKKKQIWLITDRIDKAGDNGEAFFRYMRKEHPEIHSVFVINKNCEDYRKMKQLGPVVSAKSIRYRILSLICDFIVSSHVEEYLANPFNYDNFTFRDIITAKPYIFLQHGIIKDDLSDWLKKRNQNLSGFVTTTVPEYCSILEYPYGYTEKEVWLTGIPRFDRLYREETKTITFMPTWRMYLVDSLNPETGKWSAIPDFCSSEFYQFYHGLFTHPRLLEAAEKHGYTLQALLHPNLMVYYDLFASNPHVKILDSNTEYRKIFAESNLLVTDYSSTAFDFAYLRKPVVYTHFDHETFFGGGHSYDKGYFDYERDGLGEVEYDLESTVSRLVEYIENDCALKDTYRERINRFFKFDDQNNCKRVYDKIMELKHSTT